MAMMKTEVDKANKRIAQLEQLISQSNEEKRKLFEVRFKL
jgi:hypothetical protein